MTIFLRGSVAGSWDAEHTNLGIGKQTVLQHDVSNAETDSHRRAGSQLVHWDVDESRREGIALTDLHSMVVEFAVGGRQQACWSLLVCVEK